LQYDFYAEASELRIPPGRAGMEVPERLVVVDGYQFHLPVAVIEQTPNGWRQLVGWSLKSRCGKTLLIFND